jgi:hypothetical protein
MASQAFEIMEQSSPEERARLKRDWWIVIKDLLPNMSFEEPTELSTVLSTVNSQILGQALSNLSPEKKAEVMKFFTENTPKPEE